MLENRAITLIQSAPIKDRIPSATLSVKELIKLDHTVMMHKVLNEQYLRILEQSSQEGLRFQNMKQGK